MMSARKPALFMCVLAVCLPRPASARSCNPALGNPAIPLFMWDMINTMSATWEDIPENNNVPGKKGIKHLFIQGECTACHTLVNGPGNETARFKHCANCHDPALLNNPRPFPDWLQLNTPAKLKRNSYYMSGMTKAEASIRRSQEGSMPPGAWHQGSTFRNAAVFHDTADDHAPGPHYWDSAPQPVSWCSEIETKVQQWINAGYP